MKRKRLIPVAAACLLVGAMFTGGAMAYLTDTDTTTNTFTVGDVVIDTLEPSYPGNGSDEVTDLVPLEEIQKDPQIKNTGKNRAIVFTRVDIPMEDVICAADDGTRLPQENTEMFDFRTEAGDYDSVNDGWLLLDLTYLADNGATTGEAEADYVSRLYGYESVLEENETTPSVFDVVRLANVIENQVDNSVQEIKITSYAIQADNIADITESDDYNSIFDDVMDTTFLNRVWNVYYKQSGNVVAPDADESNDQTLVNSTLNVTMTADNTHLRMNTGNGADAKTKVNVKIAYTGSGTAPTYTLTSLDKAVATVDASGNVVAVGEGDTVIVATAKNPDTGATVEARLTIQVRDVNRTN